MPTLHIHLGTFSQLVKSFYDYERTIKFKRLGDYKITAGQAIVRFKYAKITNSNEITISKTPNQNAIDFPRSFYPKKTKEKIRAGAF